MVDDTMSLDAISIVKSLPDFQEKIAGVVPQFGGKCFDITMKTSEDAARLVSTGFDYEHEVKPLRLLGRKTIHVSIFISVEFPDAELVDLLSSYGELKSKDLRRLYFTEEGFHHIERGIRVAQFLTIDRDLPRKLVVQGLEIFFRYTGQPTTCYRCNSTEHIVKNCPKQRRQAAAFQNFPHNIRRGDIQAEPNQEAMDTTSPAENSVPPWDPADPDPPPIPTDHDSSAPDSQTERPATSQAGSVANSTVQPSADTQASAVESQEQASQELFTPPPSASPAAEKSGDDTRKRPPSSPVKESRSAKRTPKSQTPKTQASIPATSTAFLRHFTQGVRREGTERVILTPYLAKDKFTELRALYLHQDKGEFESVDSELVKKKGWSPEVIAQWKLLNGKVRKDSYAKFVEYCEDLRREIPDLFKCLEHK